MSVRALHIYLVRGLAKPTAAGTSSAASASFTWTVQAPPPIARAADHPNSTRASLTPSEVWHRAKQAVRQPQPHRSTQLKELRTTVIDDVSRRGRAAVKEGQAWLDSGKPGSIKSRLRGFIEHLLAQIDKRELMLRECHQFVQEAEGAKNLNVGVDHRIILHVPRSLPSPVESTLRPFLLDRRKYHQQWTYICGALLPITALATVIPGPNIWFAWAAIRFYGHYTALKGAEELSLLITAQEGSAANVAPANPILAAVKFELLTNDDGTTEFTKSTTTPS